MPQIEKSKAAQVAATSAVSVDISMKIILIVAFFLNLVFYGCMDYALALIRCL